MTEIMDHEKEWIAKAYTDRLVQIFSTAQKDYPGGQEQKMIDISQTAKRIHDITNPFDTASNPR